MRTVGIIAEYNPFHTGHEYHIQKARALTGADYVVVVLSGDYVQRGEPAIFDKYTRTKMALRGGADLVIELPVCYATGSAEYFAEGAVKLLHELGVVDALCFGAEGHRDSFNNPAVSSFEFQQSARALLLESAAYQETLQDCLRDGLSFPKARQISLHGAGQTKASNLLSSPNNILGVEYCKAIRKFQAKMVPVPILRKGSDYASDALVGPYCSASALRHALNAKPSQLSYHRKKAGKKTPSMPDSKNADLSSFLPANCLPLFEAAKNTTLNSEDFLPLLLQKLLYNDHYEAILDVSEDLSERLLNLRFSCIEKSHEEIVSLIKTKNLTNTRIRRALLHLILDIRKDFVEEARREGTVFYAHVLGFQKGAEPLLHEIKKRSALPFFTKATHSKTQLTGIGRKMWELDVKTSHLYRGLLSQKYNLPFKTEYEISPVLYEPSHDQ